jgi:peptidoglycan/xylan/chitin deacetylase (PgdA/CDA1 family)
MSEEKFMSKKKRIKKTPIIILILLILIGVVGFVVCMMSFEFKLEGKEDDKYEINYNSSDIEEAPMKCTFFGGEVKNIKKDKEIDNKKLGDVEITYTCSKLLFSKSITVKYTIIDKEAPNIELKGKKIAVIYTGEDYTEEGYTATDNADGDVTDKVKSEKGYDNGTVGNYKMNYTVTDSSGNKGEASREILVRTTKASLECGEPGVIYLTFDDGPNNSTTTQILDVLKKHGVKATFFVTNTNGGSDDQIKREFEEGHKVAIHTSTHDYATVYASVDAFWNDMNTIGDRIKRITGKETDVLRFPGGSSNTVSRKYSSGLMTTLAKDVEEKGYSYVDWNVDSRDAEPAVTKTSDDVYRNVVNSLSKGRGNIILMHDIKTTTAGAIDRIVQYGLNNGYKFDVLTRETSVCHHRIAN